MRPEGVAAASREVKRADRARMRLRRATSREDAEDAWADFLTHAGKVYGKIRAACHGHPLDWGWWGKKLDERDRDPLLLYVHKARNSDTHRLESIAAFLDPLPVIDEHGHVYQPPTRHKGRDLNNADLVLIARLAADYLHDFVSEARSRLR
jgi:hypothetical protein